MNIARVWPLVAKKKIFKKKENSKINSNVNQCKELQKLKFCGDCRQTYEGSVCVCVCVLNPPSISVINSHWPPFRICVSRSLCCCVIAASAFAAVCSASTVQSFWPIDGGRRYHDTLRKSCEFPTTDNVSTWWNCAHHPWCDRDSRLSSAASQWFGFDPNLMRSERWNEKQG